MQGSALPVLQVLLGEASGCWWLYLHIHCAALLWNAHTANPSPKASNKTSSKGQIQIKQKQEVPYGKRKKERGKKKKVWSDQQIQLWKVLFPFPLKKLSKLFILKWNFKEIGCLPPSVAALTVFCCISACCIDYFQVRGHSWQSSTLFHFKHSQSSWNDQLERMENPSSASWQPPVSKLSNCLTQGEIIKPKPPHSCWDIHWQDSSAKALQPHSSPHPTKPNFLKSTLQRPKARIHNQKLNMDQECFQLVVILSAIDETLFRSKFRDEPKWDITE